MDVGVRHIVFMVIYLFISYFWFFLVAWVNIDAEKKKRNVTLWNTLTFFLGPLGMFLYELVTSFSKDKPDRPLNQGGVVHSPEETGKDRKIVKIVDKILNNAVVNRTTDIHMEPSQDRLTIRFRIDGFLHEYGTFPRTEGRAIISAIKVLSNLDIAQRRSHQDGSFSKTLEDRRIDFRVAISASQYGETMVIKVLDPKEGLVDITELGVLPEVEEKFYSLIFRNDGIVLITGPTGCGKTTTLYAVLNKVNNLGKNIISIEDPIEYNIPNVTQIPINPRAGVTFANSLRSVLRQDPDIIMIGEIRDIETGKIALESSLTGHLVFSTFHTKDSVSTITRLVEMGFEPYLISSSLAGVVSQRLVRLLCPQCRRPYVLPADKCIGHDEIQLKAGEQLYAPRGCSYCRNTGYRDRTGLFEILVIDKKMKELISKNAKVEEIFTYAKEQGLITLLEDGVRKIREGLTSVEEVESILR